MFAFFGVAPLVLAGAGAGGGVIAQTTGTGALGGPVGAAAGLLVGLAIVGIAAIVVYNSKVEQEVPKTDDKPCETCPKKAAEETDKKIDEITKDAKPGKDSSSKQFEKPGGQAQAEKDFDHLVGDAPVKTYPNGTKVAKLPDGTTVNVRPTSSGGQPTLEIVRPTGRGKPIKVRYD